MVEKQKRKTERERRQQPILTFIIAPNTPSLTRSGSYASRTRSSRAAYVERALSGGAAPEKSGLVPLRTLPYSVN